MRETPKWAWPVAIIVAIPITIVVMYFDIEFRYTILAIGIMGGCALMSIGITGAGIAIARSIRDRGKQ